MGSGPRGDLRAGTPRLRRRVGRPPVDRVHPRRYGDRPAGRPCPADPRRGEDGRRGTRRRRRVRARETVRHRRRVPGRQRRPAAPRRIRVPARVRHRTRGPRPAGAPDPGRNQRDHETHHRPRPAREPPVTGAEVLVEVRGHLGLLTLNRPGAMNALTLGMVRTITAALESWATDDDVATVAITGAGERGLCAGGDVVSLHRDVTAGDGTGAAEFWREEYAMNALIAAYPK